ncbi:MAG: PAS domain S-box protein [Mariniphaga sp.]
MNYQSKTKSELIAELEQLSKAYSSLKDSYDLSNDEQSKVRDEVSVGKIKLEAALESSSDAIFISDVNGRFINFNEAFATFHKFKNKVECAKVLSEYPSFLDVYTINGELVPPDQWAVPRALRGETSTNSEYLLRRKDTDESWVGSYSYAPIRNRNGAIIGSVVTGRDVTELKKALELLRKSESEFRLLAESMPQIVWITRADGLNIYFNQQWIDYTGLTLEESSGNGWAKPFHPDDRQKAWNAWQNTIKNGAIYGLECRLRRFDGIYKWWLIRGVPVVDSNGGILKWFGTCTDIDRLKRSEEELIIAKARAEESDRLKTAFLANMSHEIRTPMNGILGFSELLKEPKLSSEEQFEYISIIEKSGKRMLNIINDIIDISRIESGQIILKIGESNINEQNEFIYNFFLPEVEQKGMQLILKNPLPSKLSIIKTDGEKVIAILTNLLKNAIKYSNKGRIEFGYEKKGTFLEFFVKDHGIGIPFDRQEAIFERFIQADIGDKRAFQGAGLGLTITKSYVKMLGGRIWVESQEGRGSKFYFTIPYHPVLETRIADSAEVEENKKLKLNKKLKILIAEDDEISQFLISITLKPICRELLTVKTGIDAIKTCFENPDIDLVLMDIRMPELSGYEAARSIRQFNTDIVIIAQTAYGLAGDRERSINSGCNDYISKPINPNLLSGLIKKYFN